MSAPTPTELRAALVTLVAGATNTRTARWEKLVGEVEVLPTAVHLQSNWRVEIGGSTAGLAVLDAAIELLRDAHPFVAAKPSPGG